MAGGCGVSCGDQRRRHRHPEAWPPDGGLPTFPAAWGGGGGTRGRGASPPPLGHALGVGRGGGMLVLPCTSVIISNTHRKLQEDLRVHLRPGSPVALQPDLPAVGQARPRRPGGSRWSRQGARPQCLRRPGRSPAHTPAAGGLALVSAERASPPPVWAAAQPRRSSRPGRFEERGCHRGRGRCRVSRGSGWEVSNHRELTVLREREVSWGDASGSVNVPSDGNCGGPAGPALH